MGVAAALCRKHECLPAAIGERIAELQRRLARIGQHLPGCVPDDPEDLATRATAEASSSYVLRELRANKSWVPLDSGWAMVVPLAEPRLAA